MTNPDNLSEREQQKYVLEEAGEWLRKAKEPPGQHKEAVGRTSWKTFFECAVDQRYKISRSTLLKVIEKGGYTLTYSTPNNLILDFDCPSSDKDPHAPGGWEKEKFQTLLDRITILQNQGLAIKTAIARPSFREGCWHVLVYIPDPDGPLLQRMKDPWSRSALQLFLGSDPVKEALSWRRVAGGDANPSLLIDDAYAVENFKQLYPPEHTFTPDPSKAEEILHIADVPDPKEIKE